MRICLFGYGFIATLVGMSTFRKFHIAMAYVPVYEILIINVSDSGMLGYVIQNRREWSWKTHKGFGDFFFRKIRKGGFRGQNLI